MLNFIWKPAALLIICIVEFKEKQEPVLANKTNLDRQHFNFINTEFNKNKVYYCYSYNVLIYNVERCSKYASRL